MPELSGRVAIVTGASGAIGSAVARAFWNTPWIDDVMVLVTHAEPYLSYVEGEMNDTPWEKQTELTDSESVKKLVGDALTLKGEIGLLICAHSAPAGSDMRQLFEVDVLGTYNVCQAVLPYMQERDYGRIVLFSSIRAHAPRPGQVAYATAKAAIEGMTRALAVEYGPYGIIVNCIAPGAVESPRTQANIAAGTVTREELERRTPAGRLATPEDVAACVLWLCSPAAAMVNGQVITVDGGWSVQG